MLYRLLSAAALALIFLIAPAAIFGEELDLGETTVSDIPKLVEIVQSGSPDASYAGEVLAGFGEDAVPPLLEALKAGGDNYYVIVVLGNIKDDRAIEPLIGQLCGKDGALADAAGGSLRNYGDTAVPALVKTLNNPDCFERVLDVLKYASPSAASLKLVRGIAGSKDEPERAAAGSLLGWWKDAEGESVIKGLLQDAEPFVRRNAVSGYEMLHSQKPDGYDAELLISLLKDEDPFVRGTAARLLANFPSGETATALMDVIKNDSNQEVRSQAVIGLETSKDPRITFPLIGILQEQNPDSKLLAQTMYTLGILDAREAVPYIVEYFERGYVENTDVQQEAFDALAKIGEPVDLKLFLPYLKVGTPHHDSLEQLLSMIESLGKPSDKEVIEALEKFVETLSHPMRKDRVQRVIDAMK